MPRATSIDWSEDIGILRQLLPMASTVHVAAAEALLQQFRRLSKKPEAERKAKILAVKLVAEAMSALEDLGALCWAINQRDEQGIIAAYLNYRSGEVKAVYRAIGESRLPWSYVRLSAPPQECIDSPEADSSNLVMDMDLILGSAAKWHRVRGMIDVYNKTKHGFTVLDGPPGAESPQPGDEDAIYVLCQGRRKNRECIQLKNCTEWPERAKMVIDACADGWRNLAGLIICMHERGYDLDSIPDPLTSVPGRG